MSKYDVFISYRRDGGAETAKHVRDSLAAKGYRVFFDLESLRAGPFNTKLLEVIEQTKDFVLILPPGGLDRCADENDWVRLEVECAIAAKKNIIPVLLNGFEFPAELPESIENLRYMNGISANVEFYDAFIGKLTGFLKSRSRLIGRKRLLAVLVLAAVLGIAAFFGAEALLPRQVSPFGKVSGETYVNDMLKVDSVWDDESWTIQSRQQINSILGLVADIVLSKEETLESESGYIDFLVISNDGTANLNVHISTLGVYEATYVQSDHDAVVEMIVGEVVAEMEQSYAAMGYQNHTVSLKDYEYNDKQYSAICLSAEAMGSTMYQQILSISVKDYLYTITATTYERDFTSAVLDRLLKD